VRIQTAGPGEQPGVPARVLETQVRLPRPIAEVFAFFAEASNLGAITPRWLGFRILTPAPIRMARGTIIDYRIRLHGVPMRWRTLISLWDPPGRFVDEQIRGPYRLWRHTHTFESLHGGTLCKDRIEYDAPGGEPVHRFFVRPRVERIFAFRRAALIERFGGQGGAAVVPGNEAVNTSHSSAASATSALRCPMASSRAAGSQ
jgi:ligand-binding SRPBCC domain-containing protein